MLIQRFLHDEQADSTDMDQRKLIERARGIAQPFVPSAHVSSGGVAAALLTSAGNVYTGVCLDTTCSLGFCAEHAAVVEMLKARESEVRMIVAVRHSGDVLAPCGRCRELLWQLTPKNAATWVVLGPNVRRSLATLLPER